jgi:O-antigen/teichoic acid export membrane protein
MSEARKIAKDSAYVFGARAFSMVASLVMSVILARLLGKDMYGLVSWAIFLEGILFIFADLGVQESSAKRIAELRAKGRDISGTVASGTMIKFLVGILVSVACVAFASSIALNLNSHPDAIVSVYACALLLLLDAVSTAMYSSLYGFREMTITSCAEIVQSVSRTVLAVILVLMGFGLKGALAGLVAGSVLLLAFYLYSFKKTVLPELKNFNFSFGETRYIMGYGLFLGISWAVFKIYMSFDQFYIGAKLTMGDFICYSIAMSLALLLYYGIFAVRRVLFASFSRSAGTNSHGMLRDTYKLSFKYIAAIAIPAGVGLALLSREIVSAVYGYEYIAAAYVLVPLAAMGAFKTLEVPSSALIDGGGTARAGTFISVLVAVSNVALNLILIPGNGIMGAAISSLITLGGCSLLYHYFAMRFYNVKLPFRDISLVVIASAAMAASVEAIKAFMYAGYPARLESSIFCLSVIVACIIAAVSIYAIVLLLLGFLGREDRALLKNAAGSGPLARPVGAILLISEKARLKVSFRWPAAP